METFTEPRELVEAPRYGQDRHDAIAALELGSIDRPIVDVVAGFAALPFCYTLQCCFGHFVCGPAQDPHNLEPIGPDCAGLVEYRIAYVAFCLESSTRGRALRQTLAEVPAIDPDYVQFGSADWFWERWSNSYVLQVEPTAHMMKDRALLDRTEALHTQRVRDRFFAELRALLAEARV